MTHLRRKLLTSVTSLGVVGLARTAALAADGVLSGAISSASGKMLGGVRLSVKQDGTTITKRVYPEEAGIYFFPPLPAGNYQVWAQALSFETTKDSVDLNATKHRDFVLQT